MESLCTNGFNDIAGTEMGKARSSRARVPKSARELCFALNGVGSLIRDSESFGPRFRAAPATPTVAFVAPPRLSN